MFRRKQDVDRHVSSILGKIKEEREKNAKGYQIARLYFEVKEYDIARRYLAKFLNVRETVPNGYRLLGQIEEAVGNKENAVEAYKRFLEMGGPEKDVVLKICELYAEIGVDPGRGKYWLEKAEQLYPQSEVVFKLKEKLIASRAGQNSDEDLENLISSELVKKPHDVELRMKLLRVYLTSDRVEEAYTNAVETDRTTAFSTCLGWYECLRDVFKAYQQERDTREDEVFMFHYLVVLCNLTYLCLVDKDVVESAEALHSFDLAVHVAVNMNNPSEEWHAFVTEMQGQLFFFAGTLLLKRAQKGSVTWNDMRPLAAVFYLLCQTIPTVDAQATWFVRPKQDREKLYGWLYKNSFFRISQSGHSLYQLCQGDVSSWAHQLQQQCCTPVGQERAYEALFPIRAMRAHSSESYMMNTHKFCNTSLAMPPRRQLFDVDRVAHTFHPEKLSELVWLCLQQYTFGDPHQPDYNFKTFETLQYSVKNMDNGAAETLCQLDTEAFLYATVRCSALQVKEQQMAMEGDVSRPPMLPLCLCKKLCTPDQQQWWQTAYSFYSNSIKENFSKMRQILQRGIEVVRLVGNHGMSAAMVVHLAKTFDAKVKSLTEGTHGKRGPVNQLACLEMRASLYWNHALTVLSRLERNMRGPYAKFRLFEDIEDVDLTPDAVQEMMQDAKFASATIAMKAGRYEEAVKGFEKLTTPYASFYMAQIYKSMAQRELDGSGPEEARQQRYTALIAQAREALYRTMDHLGGNKNHELNILLTRELDDVESKLNCADWENDDSNRDDMEETSALKTPVKLHNGLHGDQTHHHSTPKSTGHSKAVRQRLLLSELTGDSPIQSQHAPMSSPSAHTRPSPERLDAQIKSINYSQSQLFKMVLDRNEELVVMYRGLVDELRDANTQLKAALGENHGLMEELKGVLMSNKASMAAMQAELAETKDSVRQLKEEFQANAAVAAASSSSFLSAQGLAASQMSAAGYLMGTPYPPSQYPPYAPAPHVAPPGAGYRYPLLPGYPPPRPATPVAPVAAVAAATRLSGTAPSSFGKVRGGDHQSVPDVMGTEDEDDDEENGLSMCGSEYGESLLQTPGAQYFMAGDPSLVQDWLPAAHPTAAPGAMTFPAQGQPTIPQPGYFASALRGQALQYAGTSAAATVQSVAMPGPGFFSTVTSAAASVPQSAIVTALSGSAGVGTQAQPIPVIGAKSTQPAFPVVKVPGEQGIVILFHDYAKLTTTGGELAVDVRVLQDTASKEGSIVVRKKDTQEIAAYHSIAHIKIVSSFNPNCFIWSQASMERKLDETFRLSFDSADRLKRMQGAVEQVIKSAGIKPPVSPAPAFAARSPAQPSPHTTAVVSTPAAVRSPQGGAAAAKPASQSSATSTTTTQALGAKMVFGGFTFTSAPIVKQGETAQGGKDAAKPGSQFKLKESSIKVTSPSATVSTTTTTTSETSKPFAGFAFTPAKPAVSAFGSAVTLTTPSGAAASGLPAPAQTFVFGQGSPAGTVSFASVGSHGAPEAFKQPKEGATGFQASTQPLFSQSSSPAKSPGGKEEEAVEEYEPIVDFKPIIDLPDLVEVKTGEEDETKVLGDRVKLFRFDSESQQWKERGIGELKILRALGTTRFRIIMRREQVLKVCANHFISADMKLTPLSTSDRAWCYTASDFAEGEIKVEKFAVKFKNPEKAGEFKAAFESCQKEIHEGEASGTDAVDAGAEQEPKESADGVKSLAEMFKPVEGSWECPGCYVNNKADVLRCLACQTVKPGAKPEDVKSPPKEDPFAPAAPTGGFGGFKFGGGAGGGEKSTPGGGGGGGFKFGAPAAGQSGGEKKSLAEMFKLAEGSWECPGCYVNNNANVLRCLACQTVKPGAKPEEVKSPPKEDPFAPAAPTGGFGGFKFGASTGDKKDDSKAVLAPGTGFKFGSTTGTTEAGGFKFGTPPGGFRFGAQQKAGDAPTAEGSSSSAGFKFSFGTPTPTTPTTTTTTTTKAVGFSFSDSKPATAAAQPSGFQFGKQQTAAASVEKRPESSSALLEQLLTSDDPPETTQRSIFGAASPGGAFVSTADGSKPSGFQAKLGQVTSPVTSEAGKEKAGFQFTFNLQKQQQSQQQQQPASPRSPEVDEHGFYLNREGDDAHIYFEPLVPLPEKIEVKTGEEDEDVLFESRAKLFRFVGGEWKERGLGVLKILQHRESGRIRLLMRREQVLKICCNHYITGDLDLKPMPRSEGKAWIWYAMDFTEGDGNMEQLAVRFRDADVANNFKAVFDDSKEKMKTPSKVEAAMSDPSKADVITKSPADVSRRLFEQEDDDDVEFLYEEKPTAEQVERARKLLLPDTFYLYENRPGCPGCIGCEDYDPSKSSPAAAAAPRGGPEKAAAASTAEAAEQPQKQPVQEEMFQKASEAMVFGDGSTMSFSTLAAASTDAPAFGGKDSGKPFHWAGAGQQLFGKGGGGEEGEDGEVVPSDDIHFEPIIPLPDLVEVKTGEEEWTPLFTQRAKVYRFDNGQWKERGIGEMKIMKHISQLLFRVLLRREQVLKVACNHLISTTMELKPMATSETAWCWVATDYTENQPQVEQFAVKFKKIEVAKEFKAIFEECQEKLRQGETEESVQERMVSSSQPPSGDHGNILHTQALDVSAQDSMSSSVQPVTGDQGNPCYTEELNVAAKDSMVSSSQPVTGDKGNPYYTQQLNVGAEDTMVSSAQPVTGDKGNPYYTQQLNVGAEDTMVSSAQPVMGDKGNPYYTQQLNVGAEDTMVSSSQPVMGDKGNPYHSKALDVAAQDAQISSTTAQPLGGDEECDGNPLFSQLLDPDGAGEEPQYDEDYDDDFEDDDEDDSTEEEDEEEEEERVEFEKRVTLFCKEDNQWNKLGMGNLRVLYDDDLNANKLLIVSDKGDQLCNHIIYMELTVEVDEKKKSCEWQPVDYTTDEPIRRHFKAYFSSSQAAEEFAIIFRKGQKLAAESEISVKFPEEIEVPEVYSTGDRSDCEGASAQK